MRPQKSPGREISRGKRGFGKKDFVVNAPPERVWRLIGKVIFSVLPGMENMEILDENNFRALLRVKMMGSEWALKLKREMVDISPPESFSVRLFLEGVGGMVKTGQKVAFAMTPVEGGKTSVACRGHGGRNGVFAPDPLLRPGPALRKDHLRGHRETAEGANF